MGELFSSVASERGVPSVGQISSKGISRPIAIGQFISQLGLASLIMSSVKSLVTLLMVRCVSAVMAYLGSGFCLVGYHPMLLGKARETGPIILVMGCSSGSSSRSWSGAFCWLKL